MLLISTQISRILHIGALVLNNNKKDDHNMTLTLYGLELIDRTVPLGHVKLYKTQRSADGMQSLLVHSSVCQVS